MTSSQKFFLVDGSGYIFRAFYAIQYLSTKDGFPTNALYGFTRMLLKTMTDAAADHVVVVFDAGKKTFRNDLYDEYKANRTECPEELLKQMPYFREISKALGLLVLEQPGYEADDIIGTLAVDFAGRGHEVTIVSGDKDLMQLVTDQVTIWDTMKDKHIGAKEVEEKFGVPPEKVTEILALMGDSSDNVPGVDGVGPKTATQLVQKYGSVEGVISSIPLIRQDSSIRNRAKICDQIEQNPEKLRLSHQLVQILSKVPLTMDGQQSSADDIFGLAARKSPDTAQLAELFGRFEFSSLLSEVPNVGETVRFNVPSDVNYRTVYAADLESWVSQLRQQKEISFDIETTSLDPNEAQIVGLSFCWSDEEAFYVPIRHKSSTSPQADWARFKELVSPIMSDASIAKCGQNLKYDINVLAAHGVEVAGVTFDSMVAAYLINPDRRSFNLTTLATDYLHKSVIEYDEVVGDADDFSGADIEKATVYACQDAHYAWLLKGVLKERIQKEDLTPLLNELEIPLIQVLAHMERRGIKLDTELLSVMSSEFTGILKTLENQIFSISGVDFNINSTKQLADVLFVKLGISTKGIKKTKTGLSTDSSVLEKLINDHPLPGLILQYRMIHKLKSTYIDALPVQISTRTGRIHSKFNQVGTSTGRLSSSEPNLQNIPIKSAEGRRIRQAFVPEKGNIFISADYSQIELRLLAHMSEDENLIASFTAGKDIHSQTAREVLGLSESDEVDSDMRRIGKTINFGIVYGMGAFRLARELGIPVNQASSYINNYFSRYPRVKEYFKHLEEAAQQTGSVSTILGRKRMISSIDTSGRDQGFAMRAAINAPLQGSAADIIKIAMIKIDKLMEQRSKSSALILQIHDELLIETEDRGVKETEEFVSQIQSIMEGVVSLRVPLKVDAGFGYNWSEAQQ